MSLYDREIEPQKTKCLTKILLFESVLALLSWLPLFIMINLIVVFDVSIHWRFHDLANVINYSNSFVNPVLYALRIPEFKQALCFCCLGSEEPAATDEDVVRRNNAAAAVTLGT